MLKTVQKTRNMVDDDLMLSRITILLQDYRLTLHQHNIYAILEDRRANHVCYWSPPLRGNAIRHPQGYGDAMHGFVAFHGRAHVF